MEWTVVPLMICAASSQALAQPIACYGDEQCSSGFYCGAHACLECLHCGDLHRESPIIPNSCIKTILECGPCDEGLVDGGVNGGCVPAETVGGTSPYLWLGIVLALVASLVAIGVVLFKYLNCYPRFTINTDVQLDPPDKTVASAPPQSEVLHTGMPAQDESMLPPPPYDHHIHHLPNGEGDHLLVKKSEDMRRDNRRENAGNPRAVPFDQSEWNSSNIINSATYVDESNHNPRDDDIEHEEHDSPFTFHNEETVLSVWRPTNDTTNNNIAVPVGSTDTQAASGQTIGVRRSLLVDNGPPAKIQCLDQNSNYNQSNGSGASSSDEGARPSAPAGGQSTQPNFINVSVNFNTIQQAHNFSR